MTKLIHVVAGALFNADGHVLIAQRPATCKLAPHKWEFPGGKIETDELPQNALTRELHEELGIKTLPRDLTPLTFLSHTQPWWHVILLLYRITQWQGTPQPLIGQGELRWIKISDLKTVDMLESNRSLVDFLQEQDR